MKIVKTLLPTLFLLAFLFFGTTIFAAATTPTPSPSGTAGTTSTTSLTATSINPGPPLGIPCGNTMCLPTEACVSYPNETDMHCVPVPLNPNPTLPPDCEDVLGLGQGVFPPNIKCWNHFVNAQTDLSLYKKTCLYEPIAEYKDKRRLKTGDQPFNKCGIGDSGPGGPAAPGGADSACDIHMLANTDVRDAELGGYGPDQTTLETQSGDFISQNYLYNALFDRPSDLSDKNKEAYRTYWRLMPASTQANLRSYAMNMANKKLINNIHFEFTDRDGTKKTTSFQKLYDALKDQVILFWHFPFVRIGCLTQYPVCPEYAQAQRELKPKFEDLFLLAERMGLSGLVTGPMHVYNAAISAFGGDLNGPYDAFVPLEFDAVRGYIIKKKDDVEEAAYNEHPNLVDNVNAARYGTNRPSLSNVSRESLPYISAIYEGLLSPKFGMIPALQPQWIIDKYATAGADIISDYKMGNSTADLPEVKIARKGLLERIKEQLASLEADPLAWIANTITNAITDLFNQDDNKLEGYTNNLANLPDDSKVDNTKDQLMDQYVNMQSCPMPVSYHLLSPKTIPKSPDDHHQVITITGKHLVWEYTPQCRNMEPECKPDPQNPGKQICTGGGCKVNDETYIEGDQCCTRMWTVSGTQHGKALTVLNNPKQTDIKQAVAGESKISLYKMLLPDGKASVPEAAIDAPIAKNGPTEGDSLSTVPGGKGKVTNPAESIMRESNLAQDSIHYLQNCWTIPQELQNSPRCENIFPPTASSSACTGELFSQIAPNPDQPSSQATSYFESNIKSRLTPELITAYSAAEQATHIPCEVFAGIHFEEGDNDPNKSLQDGSPLNGKSLTESAIQAGNELNAKAGGQINDLDTLIKAMSYYNGGGNRNCQPSADCAAATSDRCGAAVACYINEASCRCPSTIPEPGSCRAACGGVFAFKFDYSSCPPQTTGYDDPYVTNWWKSPEHDTMYLLYKYDCTQTRPQVHTRPGSLTVAISLFLSEQSSQDSNQVSL